MSESGEIVVKVLRAASIGNLHSPRTTIEIIDQIGEVASLEAVRGIFMNQAEMLADALLGSLPGGTVDALIAELMRRRASLFVIPFGQS